MSQDTDQGQFFRETMSANFALMVRIRGDFSVEQLNDALARVRARHPVLVNGISEDGGPPPVRTGEAPLFPLELREDCGPTDWIDVASAEMHRPFPPEGPSARFILLRGSDSSDLVASFHHWACDGMSGMYVLRDVLRLLGEPSAEVVPAPLPTNISSLIPKAVVQKPQNRFQVWAAIMRLRMSLFFRKYFRLPGRRKDVVAPQEIPPEELAIRRQVCILPHSLSVDQTAALVARCRAERASVHAAVCVAWLRAYAETLETPINWKRTVSSPVSFRDRLVPPVGDQSGPYLTIVSTEVDCAPGRDFWQVAREFKKKLKRDTTDDKIFVKELMFSSIEAQFKDVDLWEVFRSLFMGKIKYDFSITNLGRLDIPAQIGQLHIDAFYGPLVNSGERERTVGVSTQAGKMTQTLLFRRAWMDPAQAEQLMQRAIQLLADAVGW